MTETLLERVAGDQAVEVVVGGQPVAQRDLGAITIKHGRTDVNMRVEPATCQLVMRAPAGGLPDLGRSGVTTGTSSPLTVTAGAGMATHLGGLATSTRRRFTGLVTDLAYLPGGLLRVTATSRRARFGGYTTLIADHSGSAGLVARALVEAFAAAYADTTYSSFIGGPLVTWQPSVNPSLPQDLAQAVELLCLSTGCELTENRAGAFGFANASDRTATLAGRTFPLSHVLRVGEATKSLAGLLRRITVSDVGGATATRSTSNGYTYAELELATVLQSTAKATRADSIIRRFRAPRWRIPSLGFDLLRPAQGVDLPDWRTSMRAVLGQEFGGLIALAPGHGYPITDPRLWVEGWTEQITPASWRIDLATADFSSAAAA